jgi:hypothetical protein
MTDTSAVCAARPHPGARGLGRDIPDAATREIIGRACEPSPISTTRRPRQGRSPRGGARSREAEQSCSRRPTIDRAEALACSP